MASRLATALVLFIVAATLIAGLIAGAQNDANGPVDLIVLNGRLYTADGKEPVDGALAVRGNQILRIGSNREIRRLTRAQTQVIDAEGGSIVPGFVNTHANLVESGLAADRLDLASAESPDDVAHAIVAYAEDHPDAPWIEGSGWHASVFDKLPARDTLDDLVPDRPVVIVSDDERLAWINSKAIEIAHITRRTAPVRGGAIVKDPRTGEPTGILKDAARTLVTRLVPPPTADDRLRAILLAMRLAHEAGVTSVHNAPTPLEDLQHLGRLRRSGEMRLRVYQLLDGSGVLDAAALKKLEDVRKECPEVPLFKTGGVRIAWPPATGDADPQALASAIAGLDAAGWQTIVSIEDPARVPDAIDAFALVPRTAAFKARRHRLEVPEALDPDAEHALAQEGVSVEVRASVDPIFDPLSVIAAAVETAELADVPRLLHAAIDAMTRLAALASFDDQRKGTLAPGMLADFVILSGDAFTTPPADLRRLTVNMTVFDGKVVYDRRAEGTTTH